MVAMATVDTFVTLAPLGPTFVTWGKAWGGAEREGRLTFPFEVTHYDGRTYREGRGC